MISPSVAKSIKEAETPELASKAEAPNTDKPAPPKVEKPTPEPNTPTF